MRTALATFLTFLCVSTASANITVTGTGKMTYVPNVGYVTVGVSSEAKTAAEAWQKNAQITNKLFDVLKDLGIDEKDFKTAGLSVNPKYLHVQGREPQLVGYTVSYDLAITVRKLDRMGGLLDRLVEQGVNRNVSISFGYDHPEQLLDQARAQAIADARHKAELYVKGLGVNVGAVLEISEGQAAQPHTFRYEMMPMGAAADALRVAAGQQELGVSVTVTWTIRNS